MNDTSDNQFVNPLDNPALIYRPKSMFEGKTANEWIEEAAQRPDPIPLWMNLWYENEVACLFADTNTGKSIYAVQIGEAIAKAGHKVLYFDFEMSDKQFQMRYTDLSGEKPVFYSFDPGFIRFEFDKGSCFALDMPTIIDHIETEVVRHGSRIVIVDNISWVCNRAESGDAAGELMQLLIDLKRRKNLSLLVLAHTPKRSIYSPLTQNSLAGSKRLANFMDSIFAIGLQRLNPSRGRYIKQIKTRNGELLYGDNNVITGELVKEGDFISIVPTGFSTETDMLGEPDEEDIERQQAMAEIRQRLKDGVTYTSIQKEFKVSSATISKIKKQMVKDE